MKQENGMLCRYLGLACAVWLIACVGVSLVSCAAPRSATRTIDLPAVQRLDSGHIEFEERNGQIMVTVIDPFQDAHIFALQHAGVSKEQALRILREKQAELAMPMGVQSPQQSAPLSAASAQSESIKITVMNPSDRAHFLQVSLADGTVLVDSQVPSCANKRPSVWKRFGLARAISRLTVVVDGKRKVVELRKETREVVIDLEQGVESIEQYNAPVPWR